MKKQLLYALTSVSIITTSNASSNDIYSIKSTNCQTDVCEITIKKNSDDKNEGKIFLGKKTNSSNGSLLYTVVSNKDSNKNKSWIITCLSNYECRLFDPQNAFKADFAFENNKFYDNENSNTIIDNKFIKINSSSVQLYIGNNEVYLPFN